MLISWYTSICTKIPQLDLHLPMQSIPITTDVVHVSSNLDQDEVYNIM
jgi:hypothetical protein